MKRKGKWYSLENRQLWMIQEWVRHNSGLMQRQEVETSNEVLEGAVANVRGEVSPEIKEELYKDIQIEVELRPYDEFPENARLLEDGLSVNVVEEKEKPAKSSHKYKALTRQGEGNDRRGNKQYAASYERQSKQTIKRM